jgi:hypothetical protein
MQISQIFLSTDPSEELSPFLKHATGTIDACFPEAKHVIYNNDSLHAFIADNYEEEVLWAYDTLKPFSYKADLGRYCLLSKLGGWYIDIAIRMFNRVEMRDHVELFAFRDIQRFSFTSWSCVTGLIYAKPGCRAFDTAIEMVVANCVQQYYGITPLCPTGPTLFGKAIATTGANSSYVFGDFLELTPSHGQKNKAFVAPDGAIVAWHKPSGGGDIASLGVKGANNYNDAWHSRTVYS